MLFLSRAVVDDLLLLRRQVLEGDIRADAHLPADILHQGPHEGPPDDYRAFVDGQFLVGHQRGLVHGPGDSGSAAGRAGAGAVEGQVLRARAVEMRAADRADLLLHGRHVKRGLDIVSIGTPMAGKPGKHEPQAVQKLRHRAEGAADPGHTGSLVQCERRRDIAHVVHMGAGRLGHAPAGVSREGLQIAPGAFGVQDAESQGGLARSGDPGDPHYFVQWNIHIYIFQVVYSCAAHLHAAGQDLCCVAHRCSFSCAKV